MPVEAFWVDEPDIYALRCVGEISAQEIAESSEATLASVQAGMSYLIVDFTGVTAYPRNFLLTISRINTLVALGRQNNLHWVAFVNADEVVKLAIHAIVRRRYKLFNDFDEAVYFIRGIVKAEKSP